MKKEIIGKGAQLIGRCSYNHWSWFIPKLDQLKMLARNTWTGLQIQEKIPDIDANYTIILCLLLCIP